VVQSVAVLVALAAVSAPAPVALVVAAAVMSEVMVLD
jgi:hypothetical protein